ncbi:MAG: hypothetical protein R3F65_18105 [bacterium]
MQIRTHGSQKKMMLRSARKMNSTMNAQRVMIGMLNPQIHPSPPPAPLRPLALHQILGVVAAQEVEQPAGHLKGDVGLEVLEVAGQQIGELDLQRRRRAVGVPRRDRERLARLAEVQPGRAVVVPPHPHERADVVARRRLVVAPALGQDLRRPPLDEPHRAALKPRRLRRRDHRPRHRHLDVADRDLAARRRGAPLHRRLAHHQHLRRVVQPGARLPSEAIGEGQRDAVELGPERRVVGRLPVERVEGDLQRLQERHPVGHRLAAGRRVGRADALAGVRDRRPRAGGVGLEVRRHQRRLFGRLELHRRRRRGALGARGRNHPVQQRARRRLADRGRRDEELRHLLAQRRARPLGRPERHQQRVRHPRLRPPRRVGVDHLLRRRQRHPPRSTAGRAHPALGPVGPQPPHHEARALDALGIEPRPPEPHALRVGQQQMKHPLHRLIEPQHPLDAVVRRREPLPPHLGRQRVEQPRDEVAVGALQDHRPARRAHEARPPQGDVVIGAHHMLPAPGV